MKKRTYKKMQRRFRKWMNRTTRQTLTYHDRYWIVANHPPNLAECETEYYMAAMLHGEDLRIL